jgi:hypothetical protein
MLIQAGRRTRITGFAHRARGLALIAACCALAALLHSVAPGQRLAQGGADSVACAIRETGRARVAIDPGGELYVEPRAFVASGNDVLLAGWPAYRFARNPDGTRRQVEDENLFGVVLPERGAPIPVRTPLQARLVNSIRALPDGRGGWEVLFSENGDFPRGSFERPDSVVRLWYGVLRATGTWASLDTVPIDPELPIPSINGSSRLLRVRDTLFWATVVSVERWRRDVALFWRTASGWDHELVVTRRAGYLDLAYHDSTGIVMAVVRPDSTENPDVNSLFLYAREGGWRITERLALGRDEPNHYPRFSESRREAYLTWLSETNGGRSREVRTTALDGRAHGSPITVDSDYAVLHPPQIVHTASGETLWGTLHRVSAETEPNRIRFSRVEGDHVIQIAEWPSPYVVTFRPAIRGNGELITTGGLWDPEAEVVASLIVRNRVAYCRR